MKIYQCIKCGKICLSETESDLHSSAFLGHGNWKVLQAIHLPLKSKWYDMIESGEKKEEYRMLTWHWLKRLCYNWESGDRYVDCMSGVCCDNCLKNEYMAYPFDAVVFRYGYTKRFMVWSIERISIGQGCTNWGAPKNKETFIIRLKERLL